jgi:hypothetical protein
MMTDGRKCLATERDEEWRVKTRELSNTARGE